MLIQHSSSCMTIMSRGVVGVGGSGSFISLCYPGNATQVVLLRRKLPQKVPSLTYQRVLSVKNT